jgi:hypothetical protein
MDEELNDETTEIEVTEVLVLPNIYISRELCYPKKYVL